MKVVIKVGSSEIQTESDVMVDEGGVMITLTGQIGDTFRAFAEEGFIESLELKVKLKEARPGVQSPSRLTTG